MKANDKRQIESILNKSWFEIFKMFFIILIMKNPLIYFPIFPKIKNGFSLVSIYIPKVNLNTFGLAIGNVFYCDFFKPFSSDYYIGIFVSIKWGGIYYKRHFFIGLNRVFALAWFQSKMLLKHNQKGFISWQLIDSFYCWLYRFILLFFLAFCFSIHDIDIPSIQEMINDIQYPLSIIEKAFIK